MGYQIELNNGYYEKVNTGSKIAKGIKKTVKGAAIVAFMGLSVTAALHLYNLKPQEKTEFKEAWHSNGIAFEASINQQWKAMTGKNLTTIIDESKHEFGKITDKTHDKVKDINLVDGAKDLAHKTVTATKKVVEVVKNNPPTKQEVNNVLNDSSDAVKSQIKTIREKSSELASDILKKIKP